MNITAHLCADRQGRLGVLRAVPHGAQVIATDRAPALFVALIYTAERRPDCRRVPGYGQAVDEAGRATCIARYREEVAGTLAGLGRWAR